MRELSFLRIEREFFTGNEIQGSLVGSSLVRWNRTCSGKEFHSNIILN